MQNTNQNNTIANLSEIGTEIKLNKRYNTGNYTHIEVEFKLIGNLDTIKNNNNNLLYDLVNITHNMGTVMDQLVVSLLKSYNNVILKEPLKEPQESFNQAPINNNINSVVNLK